MKVYVNEGFKTRQTAEDYVDAYYRAYSTEGYGTQLRIFPAEKTYHIKSCRDEAAKWIVVGYRFSSAD